jgi:hypothetical protein
MSARWRVRDFLIVAGPLAVVVSIAALCTLGELARRVVHR